MSAVGEALTLMPRVGQILDSGANFESRLILDYDELAMVVRLIKAMKKKVIMTAGVYDMLHVGHARYMAQAKGLGHILVVSVDSDELTRKRKGPKRPIVPEEERIEMLVHLRYVDIVTVRDIKHGMDDDILAVMPDELVTSETTADFTDEKKQLLKEKHGIKVVTLERQAETTSTARYRKLMIDPVEGLGKSILEAIEKVVEEHVNGAKA